jgi:manganese-dependent inorganic pyrophosphatase
MVIYVVGHKNPDTDSVCAAIAMADLKRALGEDVVACVQGELNPETKFVLERFSVKAPEILKDGEGKDLILVDHAEIEQGVFNLDKACIKEVVDHHKLGGLSTPNPIEVFIRPVGCTCTIVRILYNLYNKKIPESIAGIMLCAILSDTVIFRSPTCTKEDKDIAFELANIAGVEDVGGLGFELFRVKSGIEGVSARDLVIRDFKDFNMGGKKIGIGQLELVDLDLIKERRLELYEEIRKLKDEGRHSVLFLLTDIVRAGSEILYLSDDVSIFERAFGKDLEKDNWLDGIMSRKKQVVPVLESVLK